MPNRVGATCRCAAAADGQLQGKMGLVNDVVRLQVDRSSVAMGDDVDSHVQSWEMPSVATLDDLLIAVSEWLLPTVAGPAGWCLYRDMAKPSRRLLLGLIYTRDDLGIDDLFCRCVAGDQRLSELAHEDGSLELFAKYVTRDQARPVTLNEVRAGASCTGSVPHRPSMPGGGEFRAHPR